MDAMETKTKARQLVTEVNADADGIALPADVLEKLGVEEGDAVYLTIYVDGSAELHVLSEKEQEALADAEAYMDEHPEVFRKLAE
jgi:antitoxin component of MazEF toxin-antitoxin module